MSMFNVAEFIDHTLLRPDATEVEIRKLCSEAKQFQFKSVCVESKWLNVAKEILGGTSVMPITVIGFPEGNASTDEKVRQAKEAIRLGAREVDMVLNREYLKAKNYRACFSDISAVVEVASVVPVKVILETSELTDDEKRIACSLVKAAGARFVKTSTGFSKSGANVDDVRLMREAVGTDFGVKASGGIRDLKTALAMIEAGATRLGTSASVEIVQGKTSLGSY